MGLENDLTLTVVPFLICFLCFSGRGLFFLQLLWIKIAVLGVCPYD